MERPAVTDLPSGGAPLGGHSPFVTYASEDAEFVLRVVGELKRRGYFPWIDSDQIRPGTSFAEEIDEAIKAADKALVFFGKTFGTPDAGRWQPEELRSVRERCVSGQLEMIPVLLPGVKEVPDVFGIKVRNAVRFRSDRDDDAAYSDAMDDLVWALSGRHPRKHPRGMFQIHIEVPGEGTECFAAVPFGDGRGRLELIQKAAERAGLTVVQSEDSGEEGFTADAAVAIRSAEVVIADCTSQGGSDCAAPGVMYELGYANALGKPTILIADKQTQLPPVLTVRSWIDPCSYQSQEEVISRLAEELRKRLAGLRYPYLVEQGLEDISVVLADLACLRTSFWRKLRDILLYGIEVRHQFRAISKHAHKLEQDIETVYDDLRKPAAQGDPQRSWNVFRRTFHEQYLPEHQKIEIAEQEKFGHRGETVGRAFAFLIDRANPPARDLMEQSLEYHRLMLAAMGCYFDFHAAVLARMGGDVPNRTEVAYLSSEAKELRQAVDEVNVQGYEMMKTLLEVIEQEQPVGVTNDG